MKKDVVKDVVLKYFPQAIQGSDFTSRITHYFNSKLGFSPESTLFGNSTCPDEACRNVTALGRFYGENFSMGGLAGWPFTGYCGFEAYGHHAPDTFTHPNLLVFFGPHISIGPDGTIGLIMRPNRKTPSKACGALFEAYEWLKSYNGPELDQSDRFTHQINSIKNVLLRQKKRIFSAEIPELEVVNVMYEDINSAMDFLLKKYRIHGNTERVGMIGGVIVHYGIRTGFVDPRRIEVHEPGEPPTSHSEEVLR